LRAFESEASVNFLKSRAGAVLAALILTGCTAGGASSLTVPTSNAAQASKHRTTPCTPSVWASSVNSNQVYGYTAASTAPCVTLTGPYDGLNISSPIALAMGSSPRNYLYVADLNNDRILVFTKTGVFVKAWITDYTGVLYQPWGVCVSKNGRVVGVGNRAYDNSPAQPGNAEFFHTNTPDGGSAYASASGVLDSYNFCAFDKKGNFFIDGLTSSGATKVAYLPRADVPTGGTLVDSGLGSASFWVGMYSRINSPANDTLSVGTSISYGTTETVDNWKITGPPGGPLTFSAIASYSLTGYPSTRDAVYQLAPSAGGNCTTCALYIADYGYAAILQSPPNGGAVSTYNGVGTTVGVTTNPPGQY
jgi:hypothetical protein